MGRGPRSVGFVAGLTRDAVSLVLLGGSLPASAAGSVVAQVATGLVGRLVGLGDRLPQVLLHVLVVTASLVADVLIGWVLVRSLPNKTESEREHVVAAAYFAVGFGVLVQLVGAVAAHSGPSVVYGTFAATVGLLVRIAYVSRLILGVAAWAATSHPRTGS